MRATDVEPDRLAQAVASATRLIESLPASSRVTVIEAGAQVRVPVSGASDPGAAIAALAALRPGWGGADMTSALTMAAAIAAREPDSEVVILSDGAFTLPDDSTITLPGRVSTIPIGASGDNQAIGAFSLQAESGGRSLAAFVQVVSYGAQDVRRRLVVYGDDRLLAARDLALAPNQPQALTLPGLPGDSRVLEARLEGEDILSADDRAWAAPPSGETIAVRLVGSGNRFLETALSLMPNVELTLDQPTNQPANQSPPSLTIFDSFVPTDTLPSGSLLFIAPPRSTAFFSVTGRIEAPALAPVVADDPLLRYVDVRDVAVQDASRLALPNWGRAAIVDSRTNAPLLIVGEQDGRRLAVLAFDLRRSDLPLRVAFPILIANLLDALIPGGASGLPASVEPGRSVAIPASPETSAIVVRAPDGQSHILAPSAGGAVFTRTDQPGVYEIAAQDEAGQTRELGRFAVNAFNPVESDLAPRETLPVAGASSVSAQDAPRARDEWWRPVAWIALVVLVAEWLLSHRGQVARVLHRAIPARKAV
jgi:hypothetical protein